MKRWGALLGRAFVVALLLLSFAGNVASASPGKHGPPPPPAALPDDPGYQGASLFPDDPGFGQ